MKILFLILTFTFFPTYGQANKKKAAPGVKGLLDNQTSIKNPFELRDPFKKKPRKLGRRKRNYGNYLNNNKYSNIPTIDGYKVREIRIVGVLLGKNRRAIAKIVDPKSGASSPDSYIIKEGMKIGENDAEVKAIVPGGVVLVEKIRNVYDQDEYIETVIPVTSEGN
ncbi:MAG: pilus assembly protein PilP [Bdellovibrionota bacterium]|nr:pilus assembly protein PilP [Bdellovibrionota bacterium]